MRKGVHMLTTHFPNPMTSLSIVSAFYHKESVNNIIYRNYTVKARIKTVKENILGYIL